MAGNNFIKFCRDFQLMQELVLHSENVTSISFLESRLMYIH